MPRHCTTNGMEALGRVELPTNGLGNRCSIHLSYRAVQQQFVQFIAKERSEF